MYPVVNIDRMHGTDNHADLRSVLFGSFADEEFTGADIANGSIVILDKAYDHECYYAVAPTARSTFKDLYLVASPEYLPNPLEQSLDCFVNKAGKMSRAFKLVNTDCFSITVDGVNGGSEASVGDGVYVVAGATKFAAGEGDIQFGTISRIENKGGKTWLVIDVKEFPAE